MKQQLNELLKVTITPILKSAQFKKRNLTFLRRINSVTQAINFQIVSGKYFYINVGLGFDAVCQHRNLDIIESKSFHDVIARGTQYRIEELLPYSHWRWEINEQLCSSYLLAYCFKEVVSELDSITSHQTFISSMWCKNVPFDLRLILNYLSKNYSICIEDLIEACPAYNEMQVGYKPEYWVDKFSLTNLQPLVDEDPRFKEIAEKRQQFLETGINPYQPRKERRSIMSTPLYESILLYNNDIDPDFKRLSDRLYKEFSKRKGVDIIRKENIFDMTFGEEIRFMVSKENEGHVIEESKDIAERFAKNEEERQVANSTCRICISGHGSIDVFDDYFNDFVTMVQEAELLGEGWNFSPAGGEIRKIDLSTLNNPGQVH